MEEKVEIKMRIVSSSNITAIVYEVADIQATLIRAIDFCLNIILYTRNDILVNNSVDVRDKHILTDLVLSVSVLLTEYQINE